MKILTVVYNLSKGGTQRAAQIFAEAYHSLCLDSRVLATSALGSRAEELYSKNIIIYSPIDDYNLSNIKQWSPDIIHLHSGGLSANDLFRLLEVLPMAKVIETNVFSMPAPWSSRVHVSLQMSEWCNWLFNIRTKGKFLSSIVPYPVNTDNFFKASNDQIIDFKTKYGIHHTKPVIGRIVQNIFRKWSHNLIEIFEDVSSKIDLQLLLVNPPVQVINQVAISKFRHNIIIIDSLIGDDNLRLAYSSMDLFIHIAEQGESFGMVLAESLLCQTPVITLSTPWLDNSQCEVVGNMIGGIVCTEKLAIVNSIFLLLNDTELNLKLGQSGRNHILDNYDSKLVAKLAIKSTTSLTPFPDLTIEKIIKIYNNSIGRKHKLTILLLRTQVPLLIRFAILTSRYDSILSFIRRFYFWLLKK